MKEDQRKQKVLSWFQRHNVVPSELATEVALHKYLQEDEDPDLMFKRVSSAVASVLAKRYEGLGTKKQIQRILFSLLTSLRFLPAGRILAGLGVKNRKKSMMNCAVIPLHGDSLHDIARAIDEISTALKYGQGVGIDVSKLRPKGAPVHNAANVSTGPVSFMEWLSLVNGTIGQGGRVGAMMITMRDSHPDILDFIHSKAEPNKHTQLLYRDLNQVELPEEIRREVEKVLINHQIRYANISVLISPEFMKAVFEDKDWTLRFDNDEIGIHIERRIPARKIWDEIIERAWASAEPGVIFWRYKDDIWWVEHQRYETVNPCLVKGTKLWDGDRWVRIEEGGKTFVSWKTGVKKVIRLITNAGYEIVLTPDHPVMLADGSFIEAEKTLGKEIKWDNPEKGGEGFIARVVEIRDEGEAEVWDFRVIDGGPHWKQANGGFTVHNCGETPLPGYGLCLLGSINLPAHLISSSQLFTKEAAQNWRHLIDWEALAETVRWAVLFLDTIIDLEKYPLEQQEKIQKEARRIGLGIMGLADLFIALGVRYGSPLSQEIAEEVMKFIALEAYKTSIWMASQIGPFPLWDKDKWAEGDVPARVLGELKNTEYYEMYQNTGIRNARLLAIAPTGSISILAGVSSGLEPNFEWKYQRWSPSLGSTYTVLAPILARFYGYPHNMKGLEVPDEDFWVKASDISPEERVLVQASLQKWVDGSISSTVNLPEDATKEDVRTIYEMAWKYGLKGITVYREGSRAGVLEREGKKKGKRWFISVRDALKDWKQRRSTLSPAFTTRFKYRNTSYTTAITVDEEGFPREVWLFSDQISEWHQAVAWLLSVLLKMAKDEDDVKAVLEGLRNIQGKGAVWDGIFLPSEPAVLVKSLELLFSEREQSEKGSSGENRMKKEQRNGNGSTWIEIPSVGKVAPAESMPQPPPGYVYQECPVCGSVWIVPEGKDLFSCSAGCPNCGYAKCE